MSQNHKYLLIVDGSSLLATSYYATLPKAARKEKDEEKKEEMLQRLLPKNAQGIPVNALRQFFHTLFTILHYQRPSHLAICWDISRHTFRKDLWPAYKANRSATPNSLRVQFEEAYRLCDLLGFAQMRDQEFEADDFAGSLACAMEPFMNVRILTRDKDYFQLISPRTRIWYGMADSAKVRELRKKYAMTPHLPSKVIEIDTDVLRKEFGSTPSAVIMLKSLSGDASDNIPGVSGMGENRSLSLALHYPTPALLYQDIDAASSPAARKALLRKWRGWGIYRSPLRVLTRPAQKDRMSAREMADLCFTLGQIKTDIELESHLGKPFDPDLFRFQPVSLMTFRILAQESVELPQLKKKIAAAAQRRKRKAAGVQEAAAKQTAPKPEKKKTSNKPAKKPSRKNNSYGAKKKQEEQKAAPSKGQQASKNAKPAAAKKPAQPKRRPQAKPAAQPSAAASQKSSASKKRHPSRRRKSHRSASSAGTQQS